VSERRWALEIDSILLVDSSIGRPYTRLWLVVNVVAHPRLGLGVLIDVVARSNPLSERLWKLGGERLLGARARLLFGFNTERDSHNALGFISAGSSTM
jgi:hypothetical protein